MIDFAAGQRAISSAAADACQNFGAVPVCVYRCWHGFHLTQSELLASITMVDTEKADVATPPLAAAAAATAAPFAFAQVLKDMPLPGWNLLEDALKIHVSSELARLFRGGRLASIYLYSGRRRQWSRAAMHR